MILAAAGDRGLPSLDIVSMRKERVLCPGGRSCRDKGRKRVRQLVMVMADGDVGKGIRRVGYDRRVRSTANQSAGGRRDGSRGRGAAAGGSGNSQQAGHPHSLRQQRLPRRRQRRSSRQPRHHGPVICSLPHTLHLLEELQVRRQWNCS